MRREPLVYLAGPYRGNIRSNVRQAEEWAAACARKGIHYFCPHLNSAFFDHDANAEFWLTMDLNILSRCDVLLLMPGWERSRGAQDEKAFAEREGIPVRTVEEYLAEIKEGANRDIQDT